MYPKLFLFENVRGLLSHDQGRTFAIIKKTFEQIGYSVQYQILNACFYGVGQKRKRLVVIGIRKDIHNKINFNYPKADINFTTLRDVLHNCPVSTGQKFSQVKMQIMKLIPPGGCWINLPEELAKQYLGKSYYSNGGKRGIARRISWDEPCLTIVCNWHIGVIKLISYPYFLCITFNINTKIGDLSWLITI